MNEYPGKFNKLRSETSEHEARKRLRKETFTKGFKKRKKES